MFTGIVEEIGKVQGIVRGANWAEIEIRAKKVLQGTLVGDSIAVNGVCLTVTAIHQDGFAADVMPETLRRTNLGQLQSGDEVDLERAMTLEGRFGGHIVTGHIDGTGKIQKKVKEGNAVLMTIETATPILIGIVEKGSIAIDGISLTVTAVSHKDFSVSLIPHTGKETILLKKPIGGTVNLENDVIGKYVQRLLHIEKETTGDETRKAGEEQKSHITMEFLREHGF